MTIEAPPATTCAFVTTYWRSTAKPVPDERNSQVRAVTRTVLASADRAIASAAGSDGRSTGGAGRGLRAGEGAGTPVLSGGWAGWAGDSGGGGRGGSIS